MSAMNSSRLLPAMRVLPRFSWPIVDEAAPVIVVRGIDERARRAA